ncbi:hypothetical protein RIF29_13537 [Crotalaria pallida]|uniref:Uncharacterized protein n=1 Tax=Crotalaria pallida TaxID=3830 RepID=A0AAN9P2Z4_CROPI
MEMWLRINISINPPSNLFLIPFYFLPTNLPYITSFLFLFLTIHYFLIIALPLDTMIKTYSESCKQIL